MATSKNHQVLLARRPVGEPEEGDFAIATVDMPVPRAGQMLLRTLWLSLDPHARTHERREILFAASSGR